MKKLISIVLSAVISFSIIVLPVMADDSAQVTEIDGRINLLLNNNGQLLQPVNKSENAYFVAELSSLKLTAQGVNASGGLLDNVCTEDLPWVEFTVSANESGYYSINWTGVSYNLGSRSSAFWKLTVNPGDEQLEYTVNDTNSKPYTEIVSYVQSSRYTQEYIYLNQGINTIRITNLDANDSTSSNRRRCYVKNIEFVRKLDNIASTTAEQYIGIGGNTLMNLKNGDLPFDKTYDSIDTIEYSSQNTNIATVDENGTITGVNPGRCKININITDITGSTIEATCDVTVSAANGIIVDSAYVSDGKLYVKYLTTLADASATLIIAGFDYKTDTETSAPMKTALRKVVPLVITPDVDIVTTSSGISWDIATDGGVIEIFAIDNLSDFNQIYPVVTAE